MIFEDSSNDRPTGKMYKIDKGIDVMIEWEGNSRQLERQPCRMAGRVATHHGDIEDVSFYREAETAGM